MYACLFPIQAFHLLVISTTLTSVSPRLSGKSVAVLRHLVNCYLIAVTGLPTDHRQSLEYTAGILSTDVAQ